MSIDKFGKPFSQDSDFSQLFSQGSSEGAWSTLKSFYESGWDLTKLLEEAPKQTSVREALIDALNQDAKRLLGPDFEVKLNDPESLFYRDPETGKIQYRLVIDNDANKDNDRCYVLDTFDPAQGGLANFTRETNCNDKVADILKSRFLITPSAKGNLYQNSAFELFYQGLKAQEEKSKSVMVKFLGDVDAQKLSEELDILAAQNKDLATFLNLLFIAPLPGVDMNDPALQKRLSAQLHAAQQNIKWAELEKALADQPNFQKAFTALKSHQSKTEAIESLIELYTLPKEVLSSDKVDPGLKELIQTIQSNPSLEKMIGEIQVGKKNALEFLLDPEIIRLVDLLETSEAFKEFKEEIQEKTKMALLMGLLGSSEEIALPRREEILSAISALGQGSTELEFFGAVRPFLKDPELSAYLGGMDQQVKKAQIVLQQLNGVDNLPEAYKEDLLSFLQNQNNPEQAMPSLLTLIHNPAFVSELARIPNVNQWDPQKGFYLILGLLPQLQKGEDQELKKKAVYAFNAKLYSELSSVSPNSLSNVFSDLLGGKFHQYHQFKSLGALFKDKSSQERQVYNALKAKFVNQLGDFNKRMETAGRPEEMFFLRNTHEENGVFLSVGPNGEQIAQYRFAVIPYTSDESINAKAAPKLFWTLTISSDPRGQSLQYGFSLNPVPGNEQDASVQALVNDYQKQDHSVEEEVLTNFLEVFQNEQHLPVGTGYDLLKGLFSFGPIATSRFNEIGPEGKPQSRIAYDALRQSAVALLDAYQDAETNETFIFRNTHKDNSYSVTVNEAGETVYSYRFAIIKDGSPEADAVAEAQAYWKVDFTLSEDGSMKTQQSFQKAESAPDSEQAERLISAIQGQLPELDSGTLEAFKESYLPETLITLRPQDPDSYYKVKTLDAEKGLYKIELALVMDDDAFRDNSRAMLKSTFTLDVSQSELAKVLSAKREIIDLNPDQQDPDFQLALLTLGESIESDQLADFKSLAPILTSMILANILSTQGEQELKEIPLSIDSETGNVILAAGQSVRKEGEEPSDLESFLADAPTPALKGEQTLGRVLDKEHFVATGHFNEKRDGKLSPEREAWEILKKSTYDAIAKIYGIKDALNEGPFVFRNTHEDNGYSLSFENGKVQVRYQWVLYRPGDESHTAVAYQHDVFTLNPNGTFKHHREIVAAEASRDDQKVLDFVGKMNAAEELQNLPKEAKEKFEEAWISHALPSLGYQVSELAGKQIPIMEMVALQKSLSGKLTELTQVRKEKASLLSQRGEGDLAALNAKEESLVKEYAEINAKIQDLEPKANASLVGAHLRSSLFEFMMTKYQQEVIDKDELIAFEALCQYIERAEVMPENSSYRATLLAAADRNEALSPLKALVEIYANQVVDLDADKRAAIIRSLRPEQGKSLQSLSNIDKALLDVVSTLDDQAKFQENLDLFFVASKEWYGLSYTNPDLLNQILAGNTDEARVYDRVLTASDVYDIVEKLKLNAENYYNQAEFKSRQDPSEHFPESAIKMAQTDLPKLKAQLEAYEKLLLVLGPVQEKQVASFEDALHLLQEKAEGSEYKEKAIQDLLMAKKLSVSTVEHAELIDTLKTLLEIEAAKQFQDFQVGQGRHDIRFFLRTLDVEKSYRELGRVQNEDRIELDVAILNRMRVQMLAEEKGTAGYLLFSKLGPALAESKVARHSALMNIASDVTAYNRHDKLPSTALVITDLYKDTDTAAGALNRRIRGTSDFWDDLPETIKVMGNELLNPYTIGTLAVGMGAGRIARAGFYAKWTGWGGKFVQLAGELGALTVEAGAFSLAGAFAQKMQGAGPEAFAHVGDSFASGFFMFTGTKLFPFAGLGLGLRGGMSQMALGFAGLHVGNSISRYLGYLPENYGGYGHDLMSDVVSYAHIAALGKVMNIGTGAFFKPTEASRFPLVEGKRPSFKELLNAHHANEYAGRMWKTSSLIHGAPRLMEEGSIEYPKAETRVDAINQITFDPYKGETPRGVVEGSIAYLDAEGQFQNIGSKTKLVAYIVNRANGDPVKGEHGRIQLWDVNRGQNGELEFNVDLNNVDPGHYEVRYSIRPILGNSAAEPYKVARFNEKILNRTVAKIMTGQQSEKAVEAPQVIRNIDLDDARHVEFVEIEVPASQLGNPDAQTKVEWQPYKTDGTPLTRSILEPAESKGAEPVEREVPVRYTMTRGLDGNYRVTLDTRDIAESAAQRLVPQDRDFDVYRGEFHVEGQDAAIPMATELPNIRPVITYRGVETLEIKNIQIDRLARSDKAGLNLVTRIGGEEGHEVRSTLTREKDGTYRSLINLRTIDGSEVKAAAGDTLEYWIEVEPKGFGTLKKTERLGVLGQNGFIPKSKMGTLDADGRPVWRPFKVELPESVNPQEQMPVSRYKTAAIGEEVHVTVDGEGNQNILGEVEFPVIKKGESVVLRIGDVEIFDIEKVQDSEGRYRLELVDHLDADVAIENGVQGTRYLAEGSQMTFLDGENQVTVHFSRGEITVLEVKGFTSEYKSESEAENPATGDAVLKIEAYKRTPVSEELPTDPEGGNTPPSDDPDGGNSLSGDVKAPQAPHTPPPPLPKTKIPPVKPAAPQRGSSTSFPDGKGKTGDLRKGGRFSSLLKGLNLFGGRPKTEGPLTALESGLEKSLPELHRERADRLGQRFKGLNDELPFHETVDLSRDPVVLQAKNEGDLRHARVSTQEGNGFGATMTVSHEEHGYKARNEDAGAVVLSNDGTAEDPIPGKTLAFLVADGMGGEGSNGYDSQVASGRFTEGFVESYRRPGGAAESGDLLASSFTAGHERNVKDPIGGYTAAGAMEIDLATQSMRGVAVGDVTVEHYAKDGVWLRGTEHQSLTGKSELGDLERALNPHNNIVNGGSMKGRETEFKMVELPERADGLGHSVREGEWGLVASDGLRDLVTRSEIGDIIRAVESEMPSANSEAKVEEVSQRVFDLAMVRQAMAVKYRAIVTKVKPYRKEIQAIEAKIDAEMPGMMTKDKTAAINAQVADFNKSQDPQSIPTESEQWAYDAMSKVSNNAFYLGISEADNVQVLYPQEVNALKSELDLSVNAERTLTTENIKSDNIRFTFYRHPEEPSSLGN